ncbi:putative membrane protein [Pseudarthrobacter phenanthrenivorans Sphe3]|uniref:Putative membrane protein n=1 Tax=Pseudarthrobacter phenanthrenivorans (strain DSM 18606 / JCM 16027 / LMG 23796 / Sphe3) TaxID=930171 RepID=F0M197_PSEPM|nr:DUF805 domain-containing protein [Pseudarthrobacter phenanthrenivorans]ADX73036.1 putative membrane protein [Pseudarthrobacter phenanthrenivorans Sphe3]
MTIQQPADTPRTPAPGLEVPYYGAPPVEAVKRVFQKYAVFAGRASRSEYWWWFLASALASAVLNSINPAVVNGQVTGSSALGGLWFLATVVPSLAVAVRRLHDANISGWMLLLAVIPVLGWIAVLVLLAQRENPLGQRFDRYPHPGYGQNSAGLPYTSRQPNPPGQDGQTPG